MTGGINAYLASKFRSLTKEIDRINKILYSWLGIFIFIAACAALFLMYWL